MSFDDKLKILKADATGKLKQSLGRATGREELQVEGRIEQLEAEIRRTAEQAKQDLRS